MSFNKDWVFVIYCKLTLEVYCYYSALNIFVFMQKVHKYALGVPFQWQKETQHMKTVMGEMIQIDLHV